MAVEAQKATLTVYVTPFSPNRWSLSSPAERADQRTRQAPKHQYRHDRIHHRFIHRKESCMTHTIPMHDHYTVISRAGDVHTNRVVIAGSSADAEGTHREHYPGGDIIRVFNKATASVKPTA